MASRENPALVVEHGSNELRQVVGGGGKRARFATVDAAFRRRSAEQWRAATRTALASATNHQFSVGVLKIKLRSTAIAKSHRPQYLLQQAGRGRIIGATQIGTLLVTVSHQSSGATENAILTNTTDNGEADLTTIERIEPYKPADVARISLDAIAEYELGVVVTLFDFREEELNAEAQESVKALLGATQLAFTTRANRRYVVRNSTPAVLRALAGHPAVRKLWPHTQVANPIALASTPEATNIPPPQAGATYPLVGVLDGAVSPAAPSLAAWVEHGPSFPTAAPDAQDYAHGTFIAGLIAGGAPLNPGVLGLPAEQCRVVSARVFSTLEPIGIEDLLSRIEDTVRRRPDVKVWNLSLGINTPSLGPEFSPFACELDDLAKRTGVLFVVASGNYGAPTPLRGWPAAGWHQDGRDIIGPPADAVLALSVGSVAHAHADVSAVRKNEPAAYSRRGPAPGLLPKPEVVHYGGNCSGNNTPDGCGIASLAPNGTRVLGWGTSYAAPLVASIAARTWHQLVVARHEVTPDLIRALVIHSAALHAPARPAEDLRYFGFGVPDSMDDVLTCEPYAFTTWHRVHIPNGQYIAHEFPMPECLLEGGKFVGEIVMTLCYGPPLDPDSGAEYCRANVNAKMGVLKRRKRVKKDRRSGKRSVVVQDGFQSEVPPDPRTQGAAFESSLIEHGFKWSPVKVYRRRFTHGVEGTRWQLRFEVLYRAGELPPPQPQEAFAVVTVRGLEQSQPVYRDGIRALRLKGHVARSALAMGVRVR